MRSIARALFVAVFAALLSSAAHAGQKQPVVAELFTSQGCSACPPADAFLGELAKRDDILPLSFSVTYWDYIGWKDPFAKAEFTKRQQDYATVLGNRSVYTPQMVVGGRYDEVGSDRSGIYDLVERVRAEAQRSGAADVSLTQDGDTLRVRVSGDRAPAEGAAVFLVTFDKSHETEVTRGENRGRRIVNYNVVRSIDHIGRWVGGDLELSTILADDRGNRGDGCAVIVQAGRLGAIIGAASMTLR